MINQMEVVYEDKVFKNVEPLDGNDRIVESVKTDEKVKVFAIKRKGSSLGMTFFNLSNSVVGMGVILLPLCIEQAGFATGLILTFFSFLLSSFTSYLLSVSCAKTKVYTYPALVDCVLGRYAFYVASLCNILLPFSMCIAYSKLVSRTLVEVFESFELPYGIFKSYDFLLFVSLIVCAMPLSMPKHVSFLQHFSMLSIVFVIFYTAVFVILAPSHIKTILVLPDTWSLVKPDIPQAMATLALAYTAHHNIPILFNSLHHNTNRRFSIVIFSSFGFSLVIYFLVIIFCFISFAGYITGDIITNYCIKSPLVVATRIIFCLSIITTLPLQAISQRTTIFDLFRDKLEETRFSRYIFTIMMFIVFFLVALIPMEIKTIIAITGALTTAPMVMIFPSLIYLKAIQGKFFRLNAKTIVLWIIVFIGVYLIIFGTIMACKEASFGSHPEKIRYWCINEIMNLL